MLLTSLFAVAALVAFEGKTIAQDERRPISILAVAASAPGEPYYLRVAVGDVDGDGRPDEAYLKLVCDGGAVREAFYGIAEPRGAAGARSGGLGKATPLIHYRQWHSATPELRALKPGYDIRKVASLRTGPGAAGWTAITLSDSAGLCAAVEAAARRVVKSKSNITNN